MKQAIMDIGSNSMRVTVYEVDGTVFRILFKEKIMAGLAGLSLIHISEPTRPY